MIIIASTWEQCWADLERIPETGVKQALKLSTRCLGLQIAVITKVGFHLSCSASGSMATIMPQYSHVLDSFVFIFDFGLVLLGGTRFCLFQGDKLMFQR